MLSTMLSTTDTTGSTPLFLCKSAVMCDLLLSAGADINFQNKDGSTPLMKSSLFGRIDVVCRLLEGNAKLDLCDNRGRNVHELCKQRLQRKQLKNKNNRLHATIILLQDHVSNGKRRSNETLVKEESSISAVSGVGVGGSTGCRCAIS